MAIRDASIRLENERRNSMMGRNVSYDFVIAEARDRARQSRAALESPIASQTSDTSDHQRRSSDVQEPTGSTTPSPPTSPSTQSPHGHRRHPSEAESLAGSLKENEDENERPAGVQRPEGQTRGFGEDITQWERDDRKKKLADAANRQP
jgi:hypothetical protein